MLIIDIVVHALQGGVTAMHIACYLNLLKATKAMAEEEGANINIKDDVRIPCTWSTIHVLYFTATVGGDSLDPGCEGKA